MLVLYQAHNKKSFSFQGTLFPKLPNGVSYVDPTGVYCHENRWILDPCMQITRTMFIGAVVNHHDLQSL